MVNTQEWEFQGMHALKPADLWDYVTETVEESRESQKQ